MTNTKAESIWWVNGGVSGRGAVGWKEGRCGELDWATDTFLFSASDRVTVICLSSAKKPQTIGHTESCRLTGEDTLGCSC